MIELASSQTVQAGGRETPSAITPAEIDLSCRAPLLVLFLSAAVWFLLAFLCQLLASIKFHSPQFLADTPWLTYGRIHLAGLDALLYGACLQAGLGVALWLLARLGRTRLAQAVPVLAGAISWNLAVTIGFVGILAGDSTGFDMLELPSYSVLPLFLGYLLIGISAVLMFHQRQEPLTFASQWFLFAAVFWFPWVFSTAELLLQAFPVRGITQAVIAWWYADNLAVVWLGLVGLAAVFYFASKLTGRELHSHYLALFAFWILILFGSWGGIPGSAPVPAWMPTISTISRVLLLVMLIAVALTFHLTLAGAWSKLKSEPSLAFVAVGTAGFLIAGLMRVSGALLDSQQLLQFTWFASARTQLQLYGFFALVMFGAIYYVVPRVTATAFPFRRLVWAHFWLAFTGIILLVVPLAIAGVLEARQLANPGIAFVQVSRATIPFLRASTVGDLLVVMGHLVLLVNLVALVTQFYSVRAAWAYAAITADLYQPAEVKP